MKAFGLFVLCAIFCHVTADGVCSNGGVELTGKYTKCSCPHGFKGYDCKFTVTSCEGKPCRNSGKCTENEDGSFKCKCAENYEGVLCETKVLPCDRKPCKNGARCSDDGYKCFTCQCPAGFKGHDCSQKVKACEISPCLNGGKCDNGGTKSEIKFKCQCKNGYGGILCESKSGLHTSHILERKPDFANKLTGWLNGQTNWLLCYRASQNGWQSSNFHSHCDGKGATVTIIRVGFYIFGGYTDVAWGGATGYKTSSNSFIFSLRGNGYAGGSFKAMVHKNSNAIYSNPSYGPTFGGGHDIYVKSNSNTVSGSYSNFGHSYTTPDSKSYKYGSTKAKALLAGGYNFLATEIEVFYAG